MKRGRIFVTINGVVNETKRILSPVWNHFKTSTMKVYLIESLVFLTEILRKIPVSYRFDAIEHRAPRQNQVAQVGRYSES